MKLEQERGLIPLQLDAKTTIWVRPGTDTDAVLRKFRERKEFNNYGVGTYTDFAARFRGKGKRGDY